MCKGLRHYVGFYETTPENHDFFKPKKELIKLSITNAIDNKYNIFHFNLMKFLEQNIKNICECRKIINENGYDWCKGETITQYIIRRLEEAEKLRVAKKKGLGIEGREFNAIYFINLLRNLCISNKFIKIPQ